MMTPLSTTTLTSKTKNKRALGGMRSPLCLVLCLPLIAHRVSRVREVLDDLINIVQGLFGVCLAGIGSEDADPGPSEEVLTIAEADLIVCGTFRTGPQRVILDFKQSGISSAARNERYTRRNRGHKNGVRYINPWWRGSPFTCSVRSVVVLSRTILFH